MAKGMPSVDTVHGLRTALAEEQARGRVVAVQLDSMRSKLLETAHMLADSGQELHKVSGEYAARQATYQDREDQITRLTRFLYSNYVWEMRAGDHLGMKQVDIAMRYLAVERGRWRVRVRGWWNRNVKYRALWKASTRGARRVGTKIERVMNTTTEIPVWFCQDCNSALVAKQGDRCETCLLKLGDLTDMTNWFCRDCKRVVVARRGDRCEACLLKISELAERAR
jgi:molybdenum cofactor biosynthesis enzyme MoaA